MANFRAASLWHLESSGATIAGMAGDETMQSAQPDTRLTYDDFLLFPDDGRRHEIIDGEHYVDGALNKTLHASVALDEGVTMLICINPLVPFDASSASRRSRLTVEKLNQGGLPLVLAQTFRAIIHSRMKVGMEKYRRQYPDADILLFEPDREDADMFFANIFSYAHRKRLCEAAYRNTRQSLLARRKTLEPQLAKRGVHLNLPRLTDAHRGMHAALDDPRPLLTRSPGVRQAARDLSHTLDHLERWLARAS
jgi:hypothetical protein